MELDGEFGSRPSVSVFLSFFRGQSFIREQLESLNQQRGVEISLYYHLDDRDSQTTIDVADARINCEQVKLVSGIGVPRAYFELLRSPVDATDFYAYCDQDDVWDPIKLQRAASALKDLQGTPALWVCRIRPFNESGGVKKFGNAYPSKVPTPSFSNALVETIAPGCAMVWNHALQEILVSGEIPEGALMHDTWAYLVASAFGRVLIEPETFVDYRIHDANHVGIKRSFFHRMRRLLRALRDPSISTLETQSAAFQQQFAALLGARDTASLGALLSESRKTRVSAWKEGLLVRQSKVDNIQLLPRLLMRPRSTDRILRH